jgi:hypothetical protein
MTRRLWRDACDGMEHDARCLLADPDYYPPVVQLARQDI